MAETEKLLPRRVSHLALSYNALQARPKISLPKCTEPFA